jgi:hypothetical protein
MQSDFDRQFNKSSLNFTHEGILFKPAKKTYEIFFIYFGLNRKESRRRRKSGRTRIQAIRVDDARMIIQRLSYNYADGLKISVSKAKCLLKGKSVLAMVMEQSK